MQVITRSRVQTASARTTRRSRANVARVVCQAELGRRELLSAAGAAVLATGAAPLVLPSSARAALSAIPVDQLGLLQKQDQLRTFRVRAEKTIMEFLTADDAPAAMRLVVADAAGFDFATKTGGMDGSIVTPEELGRPENRDLKPTVDKLAQAKAKIDAAGAEDGSGPISWADLLVLAAKATTQRSWEKVKISRAAIASGGAVIAGPAFAASWPVRLGRVDSNTPAPRAAPATSATATEVKDFFAGLGVAPGSTSSGLFAAKPPFWDRPAFVLWTAAASDPAAEEARFAAEDPKAFAGWKTSYDRSRKTVTRTDYEVDFVDYFTALTSLGAKFNKDAYLHQEMVQSLI